MYMAWSLYTLYNKTFMHRVTFTFNKTNAAIIILIILFIIINSNKS